jgi:hypothetical protein
LSEEHKLQVENKSAEEIFSFKRLGKWANYGISLYKAYTKQNMQSSSIDRILKQRTLAWAGSVDWLKRPNFDGETTWLTISWKTQKEMGV